MHILTNVNLLYNFKCNNIFIGNKETRSLLNFSHSPKQRFSLTRFLRRILLVNLMFILLKFSLKMF
jgi:hypothetical protein